MSKYNKYVLFLCNKALEERHKTDANLIKMYLTNLLISYDCCIIYDKWLDK